VDPDARATPAELPRGWALQLLALWSFAVAQPLFDVLGRGATFFVARRATPAEVWLFALAAALVPGLGALLAVALARRAGPRAGRAALLAAVGLAAALVAQAPLSRAAGGEALWPLAAAAVLGAGTAWAYARAAGLRSFLAILAPAPLVFAGLFLLGGPVRRVALPGAVGDVTGIQVEDAPSALFLVLDELPLQSLLSADGAIDAGRFPSFARLAALSTWFPNATASHESTELALPMILTGLRGAPDALPTAADHPRSVFTMLASSHRLRTWETFTNVCPPELDDRGELDARELEEPGLAARLGATLRDAAVVYGHVVLPGPLARRLLPAIDNTWGAFGDAAAPAQQAAPDPELEATPVESEQAEALDREAKTAAARTARPELVREFIAAIDGSAEPTLYLLHVLLPHGPFVHLPSGADYDPFGLPSDFPGGRLPQAAGIADQQLQRHLLQLGAVDRLIGALLARLDEVGLTERIAWVVLADHGINFQPGEYVRQAFPRNVGEIAWVPFLAKRPGQTQGAVDARAVETLDALPTLLDALGLESPWPLDGRSALSGAGPRATPRAVQRRFHEPLVLGDAPATSRRNLERKLALQAGAPGWSGLWAAGLPLELVGTPAAERSAGDAAGLVCELDPPRARDGRVPIVVAGRIEIAPGTATPTELWIAVDGRLRAAALTLEPRRNGIRFSALVDEAAWSEGPGEVELWIPRGEGRLERVPRS
jgi:hypothetical protein